MVRCLISHGANINAKDENGNTALHFAAKQPKPFMAECLISHGANLIAKNNAGDTPLRLANNPKIEDLLITNLVIATTERIVKIAELMNYQITNVQENNSDIADFWSMEF